MSIQRCCPSARVDQADHGEQADLFRALSDETRLTILGTLAGADGHVCVCDFTAGLPLNQPTVSHHLRILRDAALVTSERRGTWVYYRLAPDARQRMKAAVEHLFSQKVTA